MRSHAGDEVTGLKTLTLDLFSFSFAATFNSFWSQQINECLWINTLLLRFWLQSVKTCISDSKFQERATIEFAMVYWWFQIEGEPDEHRDVFIYESDDDNGQNPERFHVRKVDGPSELLQGVKRLTFYPETSPKNHLVKVGLFYTVSTAPVNLCPFIYTFCHVGVIWCLFCNLWSWYSKT